MSLIEVKVNKSIESIIKTNLQQGVAISASEVLDELHVLLQEVSLTDKNFSVDESILSRREVSSAEKYNNSIDNLHKDIEDVYDAVLLMASNRATNFERWKLRLVELHRRAETLKLSLNALLLLKKDTAGYFNTIEDYLYDINKIDTVNTTASIDTDGHVATIPMNMDTNIKLNLNNLLDRDVLFNVLTRPGLINYSVMPGLSVLNAFKEAPSIWQHRVFMGSYGSPVDAELKVKLTEDTVTINRIEFTSHSSDTNFNTIVQAQYSIDNYNWTDIPFKNNPQTIAIKGFFDFEAIDVRYIKFIMTKLAHDYSVDGKYIYEFGAKNVSFFKRGYEQQSCEIISTPLSVYHDQDDISTKMPFNSIACEVCEILPDNTDIEYFISKDNMQSWEGITPINRVHATHPKIVNVGSKKTVKSSKDVKLDLVTSYSYVTAANILLDHTLDASVKEIPYEHINVWRDIGRNDDTILTRDIVSGWRFDGTYYTTYIEIENAYGVYMNLGDTQAELDGEIATGTIFISGGSHKFKTHKSNWKQIDAFDPADDDDMRDNDPLYPYNHKLLIEGYDYDAPTSYAGDEIYSGVDMYASYIMQYVSQFDFNYNVPDDDYSKYTVVKNGDTLSFIVKYNNNISDFGGEFFYITNNEITNNVDEIVFKAKLTTENVDLSPIFSGYRIKVGN